MNTILAVLKSKSKDKSAEWDDILGLVPISSDKIPKYTHIELPIVEFYHTKDRQIFAVVDKAGRISTRSPKDTEWTASDLNVNDLSFRQLVDKRVLRRVIYAQS